MPDLRRSAALTDRNAWLAILHDGALEPNGMISWKKAMSKEDMNKVRGYVSQQARAQQAKGDPAPTRDLERQMAAISADQ